jgi:uncharacterized integral membrane protein
MIVSLILTIVAAVFAVMIAQENTTMVQATFFGYAVQGSIGIFMLLALGVGVVFGILLMVPALVGHSVSAMQNRRRIAQLEKMQIEFVVRRMSFPL